MYLLIDLLLLFIFLGVFFSVVKFRPTYFKIYPEAFKRLCVGLFLFTLVAGIKILENFVSDSFRLHLSSFKAYGLLTGGIFLISGLWSWFSFGKKVHSDSKATQKRLSCIRALSIKLENTSNLDEVLKEGFIQIMSIMGYKKGVLFKNSFRSKDFSLLAYWQIAPEDIGFLSPLLLNNIFYKEATTTKQVVAYDEVTLLPEYNTIISEEDNIGSFACVPVKSKGKILGLLGLYDEDPKRFGYEENLFLSAWGKLLGGIAEETLVAERNKSRRDYLTIAEEINQLICSDIKIEKSFPKIAELLKRVIDFDYISLAITDPSGKNMSRISLGAGGNLLLSKERSIPTDGTLVEKVNRTGEPLIEEDIGKKNYFEDSLLKASGIRSRMVLPLDHQGALILGSIPGGSYLPQDAKWLKLVCSQLSLLLLKHNLNENLTKKEKQLQRLYHLSNKALREDALSDLLNFSVETITCELPASFCRFSLLNQSENSLNSLALHKIREEGIDLKKQKRFSLADLPWHRLVLEERRPLMVNQEDPESMMPEEEASLILNDNICSALLVPVISNQKPMGIISIGEMRNWERKPFGKEEIDFVEAVASQLGLALKTALSSRIKKDGFKEWDYSHPNRFWELSLHINNYLSCVIGSAELLRKKKNLDEEEKHYLEIIERNGEKIKKALEDFSSEKMVIEKTQTEEVMV